MRIVIQRVTRASVTVDNQLKSSISKGLLILVGVCEEDNDEDMEWLANKVVNMRIFDDENGVMNKSIMDIDGQLMVISQFTLFASCKKGNRPSWFKAAKPSISEPIYERFCNMLSLLAKKPVETGIFGADMKVELINDGPVTICMDSKNRE